MGLKFENQKEESIYRVLDMLCDSLEFTGESGTEKLFILLGNVFDDKNYAEMSTILEDSHASGLCYNMLFPITERIIKESEKFVND